MIMTGIGWALLAPIFVMSAVFAIETALGLWPLRARPAGAASRQPRVAVIVPAHDEETGITATIAALLGDLPSGGRLLVVADNCSDLTAAMALRAGADVIERHDPGARGKGYALAFARDHLSADPPDVAIVIDADCRISAGGLRRLAEIALAGDRPVQASYLMTPQPEAGPMVQLSGFAFLVKNLIRQRGLARIGAPAILTGSGMAFPWPIFAQAPLATSDIVEDLRLGIALARRGQSPLFVDDVTILSDPSSAGGTLAQRRRWEHGFLATAGHAVPPLLMSGQWGTTWLGLHLLVPPLALLMMINSLILFVLAIIVGRGGPIPPLFVLSGLLAITLLLVGAVWTHARDQIRAATLLRVPLYMLWKLPIYLSGITRRERHWIRTRRD
ncbi:Glycosyltransferase, catalytic subunit of cellulose synthase and poly-beta-1,6-N-acetylglucosamine synthase [Sphingomonas sp. YR710]|nr:Glycosyltransferase, catalytic subunit of cellulose synthase and poly-beta-1,6-N-acetylglucosamine synthase [Sphingomonas sp. YR710]